MDKLRDILMYNPEKPLLFTSLYFWLFFIIVLVLFTATYKSKKLRSRVLFFLSMFFYWKTSGFFIALLLITTFTDYHTGRFIYHSKESWKRKTGLWISILVNIGLLLYFKYTYFITGTFNEIFHVEYQAINIFSKTANGIFNTGFDIYKIILPVGISFYTFQSLSYVIDMYKKKIKPVANIIDYGFFVTFFPQLVAGPIVRASHFIPQIYQNYSVSKEDFNRAVFLILNGLIKKMIISDYISINFVDRVFDSPLSYSGFENLTAIFGYGIQIYCDFSGYTDIAIGLALLLGFRIPLNFNSPYKARNIADFWQRWHISMTSWFRDYIFMPVAFKFSKGLKKQKYGVIKADYIIYFFAALFTFLVTGLWHGAAWRFVLWGGIHGVWLVAHRFWITHIRKKKKKSSVNRFFSILFTFILVNLIWVFFRSPDMTHINNMFYQVIHDFGWNLIPEMLVAYKNIFILISIAYIIHWLSTGIKTKYQGWFAATPVWSKVLIAAITIIGCYQAISAGSQPFIYFQF